MSGRKLWPIVLSGVVGAVTCLAVLAVLDSGIVDSALAAGMSVSRAHDPVVVYGSALAEFDGAPLSELVLLARIAGVWTPIPFQIDEVTAAGEYTTTEDGLLDSNDELVFMAYDAGEAAMPEEWVVDTEARLHPRYLITVTDPLEPTEAAYAYLYRSTTLGRSATHYVSFDEPAQIVTALSYTMSFSPNVFIGISDLYINGHDVDILDRQKIRAKVSGLINDTLTEEGLVGYAGAQTVTLPISGPVRALSTAGMAQFAFYPSRIDVLMNVPLSENRPPLSSIDQARVSFDWVDPVETGMAPATYYDNNTPDGVPVDGVGDAVSATPTLAWFQYSGSLGGAVFLLEVDAGQDLLSNYYKDDGAVDDGDTGDSRSFADAGIVVDRSGDSLEDVVITETTYILAPGVGNVGELAAQWLANPLAATALVQRFSAPRAFLPLLIRG